MSLVQFITYPFSYTKQWLGKRGEKMNEKQGVFQSQLKDNKDREKYIKRRRNRDRNT